MANFDFTFAWEGASGPVGPWSHLSVARLGGREAISSLYRYDLTLMAKTPAAPVEPAELVGKPATLRIATLSTPAFKVVHGIVAEARELAHHPDGVVLEVTLVPPWSRALHRKRSRIFLDKTLRQIVETVLTMDPRMTLLAHGAVEDDDGSPGYAPVAEHFTWRITDTRRLDDARVRDHCVQYNESDLAFVSRLLEEEGISYHFENGEGRCLLVLTDRDAGRIALAPAVAGASIPGREVRHFHLGARMRTQGTVLGGYNWKKPALDMSAPAEGQGEGDLLEELYHGGYPDSPSQGTPLATARVERHATEARFARGDGTIRVLSAATVFQIEHARSRYDGEYVVTELDVRGEQQGVMKLAGLAGGDALEGDVPFYASFECARRGKGAHASESRFRPARVTPWPRIVGAQTGVVSAEPSSAGSEVRVQGPDDVSNGCVRVKFHWDKDSHRHGKEPTSRWIRVSQGFAGGGQGAVWHPRVGVEVIVDFEEGDPDRPIVVGRVYNGRNPPHHSGSPVHSTLKSFSTPGAGTWNELTFDDTAGGELVFVNAGKDHTTNVNNDRREQVGADATMTVGANDVEEIGANETVLVGANDTLTVGANDTLTVGANSTTVVGANDTLVVGENQVKVVAASQTITVEGSLTELVGGAVTEAYGAARETTILGSASESLGATRSVKVAGANTQTYDGGQILLDWASREIKVGATLDTTVNGAALKVIGGEHKTVVSGAVTTDVGGAIIFITTSYEVKTPEGEEIDSQFIEIKGASTSLVGLSNEKIGTDISLTGLSMGYTGLSVDTAGLRVNIHAVKSDAHAAGVYMAGLFLHIQGIAGFI